MKIVNKTWISIIKMNKFTSYFLMATNIKNILFWKKLMKSIKVYNVLVSATFLDRENCYYLFLTQHLERWMIYIHCNYAWCLSINLNLQSDHKRYQRYVI